MRAVRRCQCLYHHVIYVWLQNMWRAAKGRCGWGCRNDTSVYKAVNLCSLSLMFSHSCLYLSVSTYYPFLAVNHRTMWMWTFFSHYLICVIPELLLERHLAVWCSSLLIINASSERGLHKACQPIRTCFISCTTLFLCTPMQWRLEIRGSHSAGIDLMLSTIPGIQRRFLSAWTTFLSLCHSCFSLWWALKKKIINMAIRGAVVCSYPDGPIAAWTSTSHFINKKIIVDCFVSVNDVELIKEMLDFLTQKMKEILL